MLELRSPLGMSVDDNDLFVADCENNRIVVLSSDLELIRELGNHKLVKPRDERSAGLATSSRNT